MITLRCGRCAERIGVDDSEAGGAVTCARCQHVNLVILSTPVPAAPKRRGMSVLRLLSTIASALLLAGSVWFVRSMLVQRLGNGVVAKAETPVEALQYDLVRQNLGNPGDPSLNLMYQDINTRHFAGALPAIPVIWEPRLADVGKLAAHAFTLKGMFGHHGHQSLILLNPDMQDDRPAIARALSHEMVHTHLFSTGDTTNNHGPAFQKVLRRLADEGAFEGVLASDDERANLRAWLAAESTRLDDERAQMDRLGGDIERERLEVEGAIADLDARVNAAKTQGGAWPAQSDFTALAKKRDAYNQRAMSANDRAQRDQADLEHFNREAARYNLMLVYPDGLDVHALVSAKPAASRSAGQ